MTTEHPIVPPTDLLLRLQDLGNLDAIELAYQAGADYELEACCEWLNYEDRGFWGRKLRAVRRPKPPSVKQQAIEALKTIAADRASHEDIVECFKVVRSALDVLPND